MRPPMCLGSCCRGAVEPPPPSRGEDSTAWALRSSRGAPCSCPPTHCQVSGRAMPPAIAWFARPPSRTESPLRRIDRAQVPCRPWTSARRGSAISPIPASRGRAGAADLPTEHGLDPVAQRWTLTGERLLSPPQLQVELFGGADEWGGDEGAGNAAGGTADECGEHRRRR